MSRPPIPVALRRKLFEEAGYRCSVPTCRGTSALQMEHNEGWAIVGTHEFENMIILCANCHARVTSGEIHKSAIRGYKQNLAVINGRYSLFEVRLMETLRETDQSAKQIAENDVLHIKGLLDDGLVELNASQGHIAVMGMSIAPLTVVLIDKGLGFLQQYFSGSEILEVAKENRP